MKLGFSQQEIIATAKSLGLPTDGFIQRRLARAIDLVATDKVTEVDASIFRVHSQYDAAKSYIVNLNGDWGCDCPDHQKHTGATCKHMIASMLYAQRQAQDEAIFVLISHPLDFFCEIKTKIKIIKTTDGEDGDYWKRCWLIAQGNRRTVVYEEPDRRLFCTCSGFGDCIHKKLVIETFTWEESTHFRPLKELKVIAREKPVVNECGSNKAKAIQDKMNGQSDSSKNNGNGADKAPSQQLDITNPFQQSEQLDIDQIEGRSNGELVHRLSNGEYVISYRGIMRLAESHDIEFETAIHDETSTVIAQGRCGTSERVSGKPINGNEVTAMELAKRNAARQLLPLAEIKGLEKKYQLESEFSWETAYKKCQDVVGGKAQVDCIINDLVNAGKIQQENPSHYDRTEWLIIHEACKEDASIVRSEKSMNNFSYNSAAFIDRCKEAIEKVRDDKAVQANEMPLEGSNGKRKLVMDKKLRTWLVDIDGTKKPISCREIAEQYDSFEKGIIKQLRQGIDSGADVSTVELD